jgi:hypothetical protein
MLAMKIRLASIFAIIRLRRATRPNTSRRPPAIGPKIIGILSLGTIVPLILWARKISIPRKISLIATMSRMS